MKLPSQKEAENVLNELESIVKGQLTKNADPVRILYFLNQFVSTPAPQDFACPRKEKSDPNGQWLQNLEDWSERKSLAAEEALHSFCSDQDQLDRACSLLKDYSKSIIDPPTRIKVPEIVLDSYDFQEAKIENAPQNEDHLEGEILCWPKQGLCIATIKAFADPETLNSQKIRKVCRQAAIPEPMLILLLPLDAQSIEDLPPNAIESELWLTKDGSTPLDTPLIIDILKSLRPQEPKITLFSKSKSHSEPEMFQ